MHIRGGYRAMTPIHVCNALAAYDEGLVRYRTLRTYFACVAVLAAREAATRVRGAKPRSTGEAVHAAELAKLTGTAEAVAVTDLKRLAKVGLLTRERDVVRLADEAHVPVRRPCDDPGRGSEFILRLHRFFLDHGDRPFRCFDRAASSRC